jgi:hypothetical protein
MEYEISNIVQLIVLELVVRQSPTGEKGFQNLLVLFFEKILKLSLSYTFTKLKIIRCLSMLC